MKPRLKNLTSESKPTPYENVLLEFDGGVLIGFWDGEEFNIGGRSFSAKEYPSWQYPQDSLFDYDRQSIYELYKVITEQDLKEFQAWREGFKTAAIDSLKELQVMITKAKSPKMDNSHIFDLNEAIRIIIKIYQAINSENK